MQIDTTQLKESMKVVKELGQRMKRPDWLLTLITAADETKEYQKEV